MGNKNSRNKNYKSSELVYSDGTYIGEVNNNLPHGLGKYYYNNGELYIGNFEQGNCSGYGSHYSNNGELIYCGEWKDNTYHGVGTYYENGQIWYWGEWKLGEANGYGILYDQYGNPTECYMPLPSQSYTPLPPPSPPPQLENKGNFYVKPTAPPMDLLYPDDDIYITIN